MDATAISILLMLLGFAALYFGAEWLVEGAVAIATHLNISRVVAGVILVAFGTSAPELFVNCIAAIRGEAGFALSNVSGSNLANLMIGFGLIGILTGVVIHHQKFLLDLIVFSIAPFVIFVIMWLSDARLPAWSALVLAAIFAFYLYRTGERMHSDEEIETTDMPFSRGILWFVLGGALLYAGGDMTVRQAEIIGRNLGISEAILGLTVVALGTSIPDITASIIAARADENEIAIGNLLGSNIFNVLFVIPMTLTFSRISGNYGLQTESAVVFGYLAVVVASAAFAIYFTQNDLLNRSIGFGMVTAYVLYIVYRIVQVL